MLLIRRCHAGRVACIKVFERRVAVKQPRSMTDATQSAAVLLANIC